jgi:hypothetical protein
LRLFQFMTSHSKPTCSYHQVVSITRPSSSAMAQPANELCTSRRNLRFCLHPRICTNASRGGERLGKNNSAKQCPLRKFRSAKYEQIKRGEELYEQKRLNQCRQLEAPNLASIQALGQKESILEVQSILLRKLAAGENHLKGLRYWYPS